MISVSFSVSRRLIPQMIEKKLYEDWISDQVLEPYTFNGII